MSRREQVEALARDIAGLLDTVLQQKTGSKRFGFGLLVFEFSQSPDDIPEMTWISNAAREDMDTALRDLLARWDADPRAGRVRYQRPVKPARGT
jgi:hypothetical protein